MLAFPRAAPRLVLLVLLVLAGARLAARASAVQREPAAAIPAAELARATWVEGRVVFPPGTPADERAFVVARGRRFSNGAHHRAEVASDGTFRVAFVSRSKRGRLELAGRYVHLERAVSFDLPVAPGAVVLEPALGALVRGRLRAGPGLAGREDQIARARAALVLIDENSPLPLPIVRTLELDPDLAFEAGGLPVGIGGRLVVERGELPEATYEIAPLAPGEAREVELVLRAGVVLRGRVVDSVGAPAADVGFEVREAGGGVEAHVFAAEGQRSRADGSFEIRGLQAGDWVVDALVTRLPTRPCRTGTLADGDVADGLTLVVGGGLTLRGRVAWEDGRPAAGAEIEWATFTGSGLPIDFDLPFGPRRDPRSAADGSFAIEGLERSATYLVAASMVASDGTLWRSRRVETSRDAEPCELVLRATSRVSGRVLDDRGEPVPRFRVRATETFARETSSVTLPGFDGRFEEREGRFVIDALGPGAWDLAVEAAGHVATTPVRVELPGDEAQVVLRLARGASVAGRVVDPSGAPVAGAAVRVETAEEAARFSIGTQEADPALSAADGTFEVAGVAVGALRVTASAAGRADSVTLALDLAPGERRGDLELRLRAGGAIEGSVVGPDGEPGAGWNVEARRFEDLESFSASCDGRGRFRIEGLTPGEWQLGVYGAGHEPVEIDERDALVEVEDGATSEVALGRPKPVKHLAHGLVLSGGAPLAGVTVIATPTWGGFAAAARATTDEQGHWRAPLAEDGLHWWDVDLGDHRALALRRVPDEPEPRLDLDVGAGKLAGRVVGPDGAPLAGVAVRIDVDRDAHDRVPVSAFGSVDTDEQGRFAFAPLPPASYRLECGRARSKTRDVAPLAQATLEGLVLGEHAALEVELARTRACALEGVVRRPDGAPAPGAAVWVRDANGAFLSRHPLATADALGGFRVDGLPQGRATALARAVGLASVESTPVELAPGREARVELALAPATRLYVDVEASVGGRPRRVQVRVFDELGRDLDDLELEGSPDGEREGVCEGTFPPGTYRVVARHEIGTRAEATVDLRGEPTAGIVLRLAR